MRRRNLISLWLGVTLSLLCSCTLNTKSAPAVDGHIVGNGGDSLQTTFMLGKTQAIRVLERLEAAEVNTLGERFFSRTKEIEVLQTLAPQLKKKIRESQHVWESELPSNCPVDHCGCTLKNKPNKVFLSYNGCRVVGRSREAGSVLLHESLHASSDLDEGQIRELTALAYELWSFWGHPDYPHWRTIPLPEKAYIDVRSGFSLVAGEEIVLVNEGQFHFYHPGKDHWRTEVAQNTLSTVADLDYESLFFGIERVHWFNDTFVVAQSSCVDGSDHHFNGARYNREEKLWESLAVENAPSIRYRAIEVATDEGIFVWGGEACDGTSGWLSDGALYLPSGKWHAIKNGPELTRETQGVWNGSEVILWGGTAIAGGFAYNPKTEKWRELSLENQPSPRNEAILARFGDKVVVVGGIAYRALGSGEPRVQLKDGAVYDTKNDSWEQLPTRVDFVPRAAGWNGKDLFVYAKGLIPFNASTLGWGSAETTPFPDLLAQGMHWTGGEFIIPLWDAKGLGRLTVYYP